MVQMNRVEVIEECRDITVFNINKTIGETDDECIRWLQRVGVLPYLNPTRFLCPWTRDPEHRMGDKPRPNQKLKFALYCLDCAAGGNERTVAYTSNTWIHRTRLPLIKVIQMTYAFCMRLEVTKACDQIGVSKVTGIEWFSFCRDVCSNFAPQQRVGGYGHIVEVYSIIVLTLLFKLSMKYR